MTTDDALAYLQSHQPLPPDSEMDEATIRKFDEVREFFVGKPDPRCVSLFLNALGDGSGFGVYQLVSDTLLSQDRECVTKELSNALKSPRRSVRNWSAEFAALFPDERFLMPLAQLLREDDFDMKYAALTALEQIPGRSRNQILLEYLDLEQDEELLDAAREILGLSVP